MSQNRWFLAQEFIHAEIQRINHPEYFAFNFQCPDLDFFIKGIKTPQHAIANRNVLNHFFDQIISSMDFTRNLYVRLKWIAYLNKLVQQIQQTSIIFPLSLKALQVYIEKLTPIQSQLKYFEKYLFTKLFKPYLQYLTKLCMLYMPLKNKKRIQLKERSHNGEDKQNIDHSNLNMKKVKESSSCFQQRNQEGLIKWYREYNFVLQTLQTFESILAELHSFFKAELPFLLNIRKYISKDLKNILKRLKQTCLSLHELNVTLIEQEELQNKISNFSQGQANIFEATESVLFTNMEDCKREDIRNFMQTPMKTLTANQTTQSILF